MNAALKICQERYNAHLPPEVSESDEVTDWLEHSAERLVCGVDITWKRRHGQPRVVTFDRFCTYLQGILNQRQIDGLDQRDSFARLLLSAMLGSQIQHGRGDTRQGGSMISNLRSDIEFRRDKALELSS